MNEAENNTNGIKGLLNNQRDQMLMPKVTTTF